MNEHLFEYEQYNLYDYLDKQEDQLYQKLKNIHPGDKIIIESYTVRLNVYKLYEVINSESETAFSSLEDCYTFLSSSLS